METPRAGYLLGWIAALDGRSGEGRAYLEQALDDAQRILPDGDELERRIRTQLGSLDGR